MAVAAKLEKMLLDAANGTIRSEDFSEEIEMYSKDFDKKHLVTQLQMLPELIRTYNECNPQTAIRTVTSVRALCDVMKSVTVSRSMFNQINKVLLTIPVTTSTVEISTLRRLKTYLHSIMSQTRLNHLMILHIHKDRTDELDIAKELRLIIDDKFFGRF